jgi:addiction module HigA family antidote
MARTKRLHNIHPGEILVEEFLKPLGVTQYQLAKSIHVPLTRIAEISRRRRAITADTALRLARFFGTTSKFWLGLQEDYDLEEELRAKHVEIESIQPLAADPHAA